MPRNLLSVSWVAALTLTLVSLVIAPASAQQLGNILNGQPLGGPTTFDGLGDAGGQATPESVVTLSAEFKAPTAGKPAMLSVTALIAPPWHTYSITQKKGPAIATVLKVDKSENYRLLGEFRPNLPPKIVKELGETLEEHEGDVTWQAPIEIRPGVDLKSLKIRGTALIQVCSTACLAPTNFDFTAELSGPATVQAPAPPTGVFQYPNSHTTLRGHLDAKVVAPGATVNVVITAETAAGFHNYELAPNDKAPRNYKPTLLVLTNVSGFAIKPTKASQEVIEAPGPVPGEPNQRFYNSPVTWTTPIVVPKDAQPGPYVVAGLIGYQACNELNCDMPRGAKFEATVMVGAKSAAGNVPLAFSEATYVAVATEAKARPLVVGPETSEIIDVAGLSSLPLVILSSLFGGLLLNFMPCVLPVIGLKILSFAEQAGRSRGQILALNLWYSAGLLAVFMVLATLASAANLGLRDSNLGWGEQFSSTSFNVTMVAVVFVFALSFLGVWEIPIPGFVGSGKANDVALREGAVGAFAKGVLTTVLATPCSGPLLGAVFGYTLNQPPTITYLIFACIGLGMASPYLLIGAFPSLVRFIPKPGAWMDTFKHMMGFAMLGTIVFFFSFMDRDYFVATFALMVGLWAACWWIGRVSLVETFSRKSKAWVQGALFAALIGFCSFNWLTPHESKIPWQSFSHAELTRLTSEGHTVMVEFTADWCPNCKVNLATAIDTEEVRQLLETNHVVPLLADYTKFSPEIKQMLAALKNPSIPLLAIFPAGKPNAPIVMPDLIFKKDLLENLREAGPSRPSDEGKEMTASTAR